MNPVNPIWLLLIFIICALASFLLCSLARVLFPKFRSGEFKPGTHRSDIPAGAMPAGGREIKTIELPLVGGPAFTIAIVGTGIAAGFVFNLNTDQWILLLIGLAATLGYALVGFVDDWRKVYRKEGISERTKFTSIFLVGVIAAVLYFFLLPDSGQQAYSIWKDLPIIGSLVCTGPVRDATGHIVPNVCAITGNPVAYYGWLIFLMFLMGSIGTATTVCVDFSDGLDGLAGGLVFSASLAMGIIIAGTVGQQPSGVVLEVLVLLGAGGILGYLPLNWPSAWAARRGKAKRRAKIYMGDCGALSIGGILAMTAIFSRNETLFLLISGAFVLEGLSALISARILTPFFRGRLQLLRFASSHEFVHHTEFPLPFLATPLHHHFDLLGWDRRRLVYGAWALGACFAALGVMVDLDGILWQRYIIRFLCLILAAFIWSSGSWSKAYFVGKHPAERSRRRRLALYYGYPYRLMGLRLYHMVEIIEASEDVIETPVEEAALWQRMSIFDARAILGLYCYRAGYYPAAMAQWTRIPERNRLLRPEIGHLLTEVDNRLALEKQETQPMRRDQIMHEQEPILTGNLPLADLPNPYEPVSHQEMGRGLDEPAEDWPVSPASTPEEDDEEQKMTAPLRGDASTMLASNGHSDTAHEHSQPSIALEARDSSTTRSSWLSRLKRTPSHKPDTKVP